MPLSISLPTTKADGDVSHTAGHNATNTAVNSIGAVVDTPVHAVGSSGSSLTIDASSSSGWVKTITLSANCTFTLTGATASYVAQLELILTQDGTGSRTVTWPAAVKWSGGAPTLSTTAAAVDRVVLVSYNGGTTWYGDLVGTGYA